MSDLFDKLKKIENADIKWFQSLPEKERNELTTIVIQRWLYGTSHSSQVLNLNECNKLLWKIPSQHKDLIFYMLCATIAKTNQRYKWYKMPKFNRNQNLDLLMEYYDCSKYEAQQLLDITITPEDIEEIKIELGKN